MTKAFEESAQEGFKKPTALLGGKNLNLYIGLAGPVDLLKKLLSSGPREGHVRMLGRPPLDFKPPAAEKYRPLHLPIFHNPKSGEFGFADLLPQNLVPPHQHESPLDDSARRALGKRARGILAGKRFFRWHRIGHGMQVQQYH